MKKILLILLTLTVTGITVNVSAQNGCSGGTGACALAVTNASVTLKTATPIGAGQCELVFDAEFDLTYNNGNKEIFFHSWLANDYSSSFVCGGGTGAAPTSATLGTAIDQATKSILDIGLDNSVARGAVGVAVNVPILTTYNVDPTVVLISPLNSPGMTATKTFTGTTGVDHVRLTNMRIIINQACDATLSVKTDVWSRNGTNSPAQCWFVGLQQVYNDPNISVQKSCTNPRSFSVGLTTLNATDLHVTYEIWMNDDGNTTFNPVALFATPGDHLAVTVGPFVLNAATPYSATGQNLPGVWGNQYPYYQSGIWLRVIVAELPGNVLQSVLIEPSCNILPIKLRSFDANRNKSNVDLKWVTEIETNNKGFYVERKLANGGWEQVTFVTSQAPNGNSNSPLTYVLTDLNNTKGISQYRLRQVDIDGKESYSQIRSVRGDGQKTNTIIYPNPSGDGKVNIVFEGTNTIRDVSLMDVSGKTLKQWKGVTNNNIRIDNLNAGFYTVRIVDVETGEQVVEKFIVNKR